LRRNEQRSASLLVFGLYVCTAVKQNLYLSTIAIAGRLLNVFRLLAGTPFCFFTLFVRLLIRLLCRRQTARHQQ
jgi:hypothetical protein